MKKIFALIGLLFVLPSCVTYKYTREQYDMAINSTFKGRSINEILQGTPYPIQVSPDGKGGNIYNLDLSSNISMPAYSRSNTYSNYNVTPGYNSVNIQNNSTTTTTFYPSQSFSTIEFINLWVNSSGTVYLVNYKLSPQKCNSMYEIYKRKLGY